MAAPINRMVDAVMRCVKCDAPMGTCDCWTRCSCGWFAEKGKPCRNPKTTRCSTKMRYGKRGAHGAQDGTR